MELARVRLRKGGGGQGQSGAGRKAWEAASNGSHIHVVVTGIRSPVSTEHALEKRML